MNPATIRVLGQTCRPLERVATVGAILGLTRATAYRVAAADAWPFVGPPASRFVVVPALLEQLGLRYEVGPEDEASPR